MSRRPRTLVTEAMATGIRAARGAGQSYSSIGQMFGIATMTAHRVINDPMWGRVIVRPSLAQRLEAKTEKTEGCWRWLGFKDQAGYGRIGLATDKGKRSIQAQRASWAVYRGPIPQGAHVLHRCDNPECTNPEHLFLGSNLDNIRDRIAKGRSRSGDQRGEHNGNAKLTVEQVAAIRADARASSAIAVDYGMSRTMIKYIKAGAFWKDADAL